MILADMILRFQQQLETELGVTNGLVKITLSHECFDRAMVQMFRETKYGTYSYTPASMSDCKICDVRVEARNAE